MTAKLVQDPDGGLRYAWRDAPEAGWSSIAELYRDVCWRWTGLCPGGEMQVQMPSSWECFFDDLPTRSVWHTFEVGSGWPPFAVVHRRRHLHDAPWRVRLLSRCLPRRLVAHWWVHDVTLTLRKPT